MAKKILRGFTGNDVELCRTTSQRAGAKITELLMEEHIPFTKNAHKIPFFRRDKYNGASQIYVISINPHRYGQARRALDGQELTLRQKVVLSNY